MQNVVKPKITRENSHPSVFSFVIWIGKQRPVLE